MSDEEMESLQEELEHYQEEKEKIRSVIGQIGGRASLKKDRAINTVFIVAISVIFTLDVLRHILQIAVPLPPLFSIEIGVLLVSIKIIYMITRQAKVEHFQFWILHSIEFRLNVLSKQMQEISREGGKK
ncbi:hypothetical protein JXI42_03810 [bacterium]|nr:hypothetical protein [bacterium]